jgi:signal transduction histidine kinase
LIDIGAISRPVDLTAFLYEPADVVRQRSDWLNARLLIAAGAVSLLLIAGLLWQFRRAAAGDLSAPDGEGAQTRASPLSTLGKRLLDVLRDRARLSAALMTPRLGAAVARWRTTAVDLLNRSGDAIRQLIGSPSATAPRPGPTDLNTGLMALERSLRRRIPRSVHYRFSLLPELWLCHADSGAVALAVRDLVAAAVADMPAGGDLVVGTRQYAIDDAAAAELGAEAVGDYVRLTVKDSGTGLSAERLDGISDPETTVRPAVAAAQELTRRLGGFTRVESLEGVGTAVHLYFCRAYPSADNARQSQDEALPARAEAA